MKLITKLATGQFKVLTNGVPGSELELDFNPIISAKKLTGDYMIIHSSAKPFMPRANGEFIRVGMILTVQQLLVR